MNLDFDKKKFTCKFDYCIGKAEDRRELFDDLLLMRRQLGEVPVLLAGDCFPVIAGDVRDDSDLVRGESAEAGMADQVVRVLVMLLIGDVHPRFVEQRRVFEELTLAGAQHVQVLRLIEDPQRQPRHVAGMREVDMAPFRESHHR